jgi:hypothetical protein
VSINNRLALRFCHLNQRHWLVFSCLYAGCPNPINALECAKTLVSCLLHVRLQLRYMHKLILILPLLLWFATAEAQRMYDGSGRQIGRVDGERYYDGSGRLLGRVDGERIYDGAGRNIGRIDGERIYDGKGRLIGRVDGDRLYSGTGSNLGRVDGDRVYDGSGRFIGRADGLRRRQVILFFYFYM